MNIDRSLEVLEKIRKGKFIEHKELSEALQFAINLLTTYKNLSGGGIVPEEKGTLRVARIIDSDDELREEGFNEARHLTLLALTKFCREELEGVIDSSELAKNYKNLMETHAGDMLNIAQNGFVAMKKELL